MIRGFAHDGLVVSVEAPEADLAWLEEFMGPAFAIVPAAPAGVSISFEADPNLAVHGTHAKGPVVFALDSGPIRLPALPTVDGVRLSDVAAGTAFDVTRGGLRVRIGYRGNRLDARVRLMRVVREYAHNHSIATGGVMLHAAAVTLAGSAVAIVGTKGAGKTTLAMRLLQTPGVAYLANDRVLVRLDEENPLALGVPTVVSIRPGTRASLPRASGRLQQYGDYRETARERASHGSIALDEADETWRVSPGQLCQALDCRWRASAPLGCLLFLPPNEAPSQPLRRLSRREATAAVDDAILCGESGRYTSDVFRVSGDGVPNQAELRARCEAVVSRSVCLRGRLPGDAGVEDTRAVLQECLGLPA